MGKLASERVVVSAPMSFDGSARRIWRITDQDHGGLRAALIVLALLLIGCAWLVVAGWYLMFGLLMVPYRLLRRGSRKRKAEVLRHRETMAVLKRAS